MSDTGVIFISIDDNEQANLKLLCDSVFGESNFVSNVSRITTKRVKGDSEGINKIHDYLYIYAVSPNYKINHRPKEDYSIYQLEDEYINTRGKHLIRPLDNGTINYSKTLDYEIVAPDGSKIVAGNDYNLFDKRKAGEYKTKDWCFRWSEEKFKWGVENNFIVFKKTKNNFRVYFKIYQFVDNNLNPTTKYDNFLSIIDNCYNNQATTEIKKLFGESAFTYPKPISLLKEVLAMSGKKNSTILDFFAGSGTTGHAVLELNKEDGGNRQFILCTNNENNICEEVTYPRIKKVIEGYGAAGSPTAAGIPANVRYFKTDFIPRTKNKDQNKINITQRCTELLCLKEGIFEELPRHCEEELLRHCGLDPQSPNYDGDSCFRRNDDLVLGDSCFRRNDDLVLGGSCFRRNDGENEVKYQVFCNGSRYMAVYYGFLSDDFFKLRDIMNEIEGEKMLYCFTLNPLGLETDDFADWKNIRLEPIPQKILDVYNQLFKK